MDTIQKLEMKKISIEFPGVKALQNVDFTVKAGEIHALIGANGAGKSTLMKILGGVYQGFTGEIMMNNELVSIHNPHDAKKHGVVVVYQEVDTALVPNLSVAENIMIDYIVNDHKKVFINWKAIKKEAKKALDMIGLNVNVNRLVSELTLSEKQLVLLARAVFQNAKYLVLDEPTAPLSVEETNRLFEIVRKLQKTGVSVIFISHRLYEIFEICETITILKDGKLVGEYPINGLTIDDVVEKMLGRKMEQAIPKLDHKTDEIRLEVTNISDGFLVENVSFNVHKGEIVGIAGLVGAGKTELANVLFGVTKKTTGSIYFDGVEVSPKNPSDAVKKHFALVPEERRKSGIFVEENIETNLTLPTLHKFTKHSFMNQKKLRDVSRELIRTVGVKTTNEKKRVAELSGGNQQKVAIGKWINSDAEVFILDEPTKGVDVGSKSEIYQLIGELVKQGKSVIYISCEFSEILGLTDRTYVMYDGMIRKELITANTDEEELLYYSTGGADNVTKNESIS